MSNIVLNILPPKELKINVTQKVIGLKVINKSAGITILQSNIAIKVSNTVLGFTVVQKSIKITVSTMGVRGLKGEKGDDGPAVNTIYGEELSGLINGSNAVFTTAFNFQPGKLALYINGLLQKIILDYQTVGTQTIILSNSPQVGEQITVSYIIL